MNTIVSLVIIPFSSSFRVSNKLYKKRNKGNGRDAYVLANGPSLAECLKDANKRDVFTKNTIIVMNNFANSEYFGIIRPSYYIIMDSLYYDEEHLKQSVSDRQLFDKMNEVDWDMTLFLSHGFNINAITSRIHNPHIRIEEFNVTKVVGFKWIQNFFYNYYLGIPSCRNVIIPALLLMINQGFHRVFLYGAEFSWTKYIDVDPQNNKAFLNDTHFYNKDNIHYYDKGWYKWYLESVVDMLNGTEQIEYYAKNKGVQVINRTPGSFIDAFPYENPSKIEYEEK